MKNKKEKSKGEKVLNFLDQNRKCIYGVIGGILITALVATIIWPDRIATLSDGTQPIAEIDGKNVTADELYEDMKNYYSVSQLLDRIDNIVLEKKYEETTEMNEEVEETANSYYTQYEQYYQGTKEEFLSYYGLSSHEEFIKVLKLNYRRNEYYNEYVESLITDKEIEKYYEDEVFGDIDSKHLLVKVDDDRTEEEAKQIANEIIEKLNSGKTFDEVKEEYKDQTTYEELGYLAFNASIQDSYMEAIQGLSNDSYTKEPVQTTYGYHVIYRIDQKEKASLEDLKDAIIEVLSENKKSEDENLYYKALQNLREEYNLTFYDTVMESKYNEYIKSYK